MRSALINFVSFFDRNYNLIFNRSKCVRLKNLLNDGVPYTYGSLVTLEDGRDLKCLGNFWFLELKYRVLRLDGGYGKLKEMFEALNDSHDKEN